MKHAGKLRLKLGSSTDLQVSDDDVVVQIGWRSAVLRLLLVLFAVILVGETVTRSLALHISGLSTAAQLAADLAISTLLLTPILYFAFIRPLLSHASRRLEYERRLVTSEDQFRTLFETMAQGVVYQSAEGVIISANPAAERILGLTLNQLQERVSADPEWKAIHEDGSDFPGEDHPSMTALCTGEEVRDVVMGVYNPKTKQHTWISVSATPQFRPGEKKPYQVYTTFQDITERRQAEENSRWLASFPALDPMPVLEIDEKNGIVYINPAAQELFPSLENEQLNHPFVNGAMNYFTELSNLTKTHDEREIEANGRWYLQTFSLVVPDKLHVYSRDITERKQVDEAIRASEANYRTIFDAASEAMIVHDSDTGAIVEVNRKCCEMFGYTRKDMRGLITADISAEEPAYTQENALRWMRRAMKGKAQLFEWKGKDISGRVFWTEIAMKRITIAGQSRVLASVRDISERKHFEEAVAARAFWEGMAQTMHSGLVVIAPNDTLSYANEAFYDLVGYSSDELAGMPPPFPWMDERPHDDPLQSEEETRNQQIHVRHKSGRHIPVIVSVSDLKDEQGNVISRFAIYQDVSALVAMEEQLARNESLALLGQLAGSIGHELRNPLGVVQSSVYYLRSKLKDRDEKIDQHLDRLEHSVAFSDKVITDLLSYARVPNLAKRPMAMGVFMNKLLEEFAENEKVNAVVNVETDKNIMADETQMIQLFRNLISNAHDAMPDGGQLSISVRPSAEEVMEIGVSDTGQGMTEEVLAKAFEPLYTTKARGAGFGLAICKKIVESHGGSISITSEPGKGTQVLVSLPM